jgi:tol-pal system protein YbgF
MDLLNQVTDLQRQVQTLRGDIEVQAHTLEGMQKRQRDLYLDIDRRLHRLEAGGVKGQTGDMPTAPVSGAAPAAAAPATGVQAPGVQAPPAPAASGAASTAAMALSPADQRKAYDKALELLKEGRYNEAAAAFGGFLKQYPDSSYSDNAQYWLGEVYYVTRQFKPALAEFEKVPKNYPDSTKVADARLKMGYIEYELKNWGEARKLLGDVVAVYPGTTSARLAQERLDRMQKEGH